VLGRTASALSILLLLMRGGRCVRFDSGLGSDVRRARTFRPVRPSLFASLIVADHPPTPAGRSGGQRSRDGPAGGGRWGGRSGARLGRSGRAEWSAGGRRCEMRAELMGVERCGLGRGARFRVWGSSVVRAMKSTSPSSWSGRPRAGGDKAGNLRSPVDLGVDRVARTFEAHWFHEEQVRVDRWGPDRAVVPLWGERP